MRPSSYIRGSKLACMTALRHCYDTLPEEEKKKHAKRIEKFNVDKLFMKLETIDQRLFSPIP
jgi:hypothetical protein